MNGIHDEGVGPRGGRVILFVVDYDADSKAFEIIPWASSWICLRWVSP